MVLMYEMLSSFLIQRSGVLICYTGVVSMLSHVSPCFWAVLQWHWVAWRSCMGLSHATASWHLTEHSWVSPAFTAMSDAPMRCGSILVLPVQNKEEVMEKKRWRLLASPSKNPNSQECLSRPFTSWVPEKCKSTDHRELHSCLLRQPSTSGIMDTSGFISLLAYYF